MIIFNNSINISKIAKMFSKSRTTIYNYINKFKEKIQNGEAVLGTFIELNNPAIGQIAGMAGYDFVILDGEHGEIAVEDAADLARAAALAGTAAIFRVNANDTTLIGKVLDCGADGVEIPEIGSAAEAQKAINGAKFTPEGERGCNRFVQAGEYGRMTSDQFFGESNAKTIVVLQVEGQDGVNNLPEILKVKGTDVVFIGPYDLSASLGVPGQTEHPKVLEQIDKILAMGKEQGVAIGLYVDSIESAIAWKKRGVQYLALQTDTVSLYQHFKANTDKFHAE